MSAGDMDTISRWSARCQAAAAYLARPPKADVLGVYTPSARSWSTAGRPTSRWATTRGCCGGPARAGFLARACVCTSPRAAAGARPTRQMASGR
eukprot:2873848-Prymnesium_polylepis.1